MAVITYPTLSRNPESCIFGIDSNTEVFTSPFDGTVQSLERPGRKWYGEVTYTQLERSDARLLEAFLVQLKGRANRFYLQDFSRELPEGNPLGTPVLAAALNKGDNSVSSSGWTISATGVLLIGDRIQIGDNYLLVTANVNADGGGLATIPVAPEASFFAAISTSIITSEPKARFMLERDSVRWSVRKPNLMDVRFSFTEALT